LRALGPGSVSSFLKIILDVVYVALLIAVAAILIGAAALIVLMVDPSLVDVNLWARLRAQGVSAAIIGVGLAAAAAYTGGVLLIVSQLRRIFLTLTAGDPFHPANVRRLRMIGVTLAGLELVGYPVAFLQVRVGVPAARAGGLVPSLIPWFAVLVIFVLAEVFREGARLRREAELTI
jgi:hypothetical protein